MLRKASRGDAMATTPTPLAPVGPSAPNLTVKNLGQQFWADAYGKEVQTAATYSYTWLADQFGHIAIGMVTNFLATLAAGWVVVLISFLATGWPLNSFVATLIAGLVIALISSLAPWAAGGVIALIAVLVPLAAGGLIARLSASSSELSQIWAAGLQAPSTSLLVMITGLVITAIGASLWELSAYRSSVRNATGAFPLDISLLRDNAVIATVYIVLGAVLGFAFRLHAVNGWPAWSSNSAPALADGLVNLGRRGHSGGLACAALAPPEDNLAKGCPALSVPSRRRSTDNRHRGRKRVAEFDRGRRATGGEAAVPNRDRRPDRVRTYAHGGWHRYRVRVQEQ